MTEFILMYQGGADMGSMTPEQGKVHREKWMAWIGGLGDKVVSAGQPLKGNKNITGTGVAEAKGADAINGFAVIRAADMDEALEIAGADPFLELGGTMQVAEMVQMGGKA